MIIIKSQSYSPRHRLNRIRTIIGGLLIKFDFGRIITSDKIIGKTKSYRIIACKIGIYWTYAYFVAARFNKVGICYLGSIDLIDDINHI